MFGITASLLAPVIGSLADRHGVRKVALLSLIGFIITFSAFYFMPGSLAAYYGLWFAVGLVGIGSTPVTWSRAISMRFMKNRGLALGMMLIGTSAAAFIVPKIAVWAIQNAGWREMFPIVALLPLLIALPVGLLFFREPRPDERPAQLSSADGSVAGMTFKEAAHTKQFWLLWVSILLIALVYGIVRDKAGSYDPVLSMAAVVFVIGGALLLLLGRYPNQAKAR